MQTIESIKQEYLNLFLAYNQQKYQIHLSGEDSEDYLLSPFDLEVFRNSEILKHIPNAVKLAYQYYSDNVEGWPRICKVPVGNSFSYAICVTTDGDDGWLEIYNNEGDFIACGRTYLELISWGTLDETRRYTKTVDYPSELSDRQERTLWSRQ